MASTETSRAAEPRRGVALLRAFGFAAAVVLGGVAIWLIVTSTSQKRIEIGVLTGLWGLLLGACSVFGSRQDHQQAAVADPGTALGIRSDAALARAQDAAAQREFQARLEAMLRREVQESVGRELAGLRSEVSALRAEILEKVGGQLRLERTETTRLFGSDLEALQREVRQLKVRQLGDGSVDTFDAIDVEAEEIRESAPQRPIAPPAPPTPRTAPATPTGVPAAAAPAAAAPAAAALAAAAPAAARAAAASAQTAPAQTAPAASAPAAAAHRPLEPFRGGIPQRTFDSSPVAPPP
ncbi:DUF6779 domain-containing protein, partial [Jatrophihabitans sp.]|uniref:DUF6779 domain-containing protein n=1 Tax=Jatrophihabitans sp. TaxID=1932789 RepID=UPI0030C7309D|nr:hypothetical protein [Jatrophihabitans sp.]